MRIKMLRERAAEKAAMFIAWRLPRRVVMWCAIRVTAAATTGKYANVPVPEVTAMDAIGAWDGAGQPIEMLQDLAEATHGTIDDVTVLPDGSAFATMTLPLPDDHWLTRPGDNNPPMGFRLGMDHPRHDEMVQIIRAAARYAIRASTMNGADADFDPDAMVQNMVVGMIGYWTPDGLSGEAMFNPDPIPPRVGPGL